MAGPVQAAEREQNQDRRDVIAAAAARCFERWGFSRTRMEDVAREAGVARPALYRYYDGKEALLREVMVRHIHERSRELHQRLRREGPAGPLLVKALLEGIVGDGVGAGEWGLSASILGPDAMHDTARLVAENDAIAAAMAAHWRPYLDYAQARGELREGVDLDHASRWLTLIVFTFLTLPELTPPHEDLPAYLRTFVVGAVLA